MANGKCNLMHTYLVYDLHSWWTNFSENADDRTDTTGNLWDSVYCTPQYKWRWQVFKPGNLPITLLCRFSYLQNTFIILYRIILQRQTNSIFSSHCTMTSDHSTKDKIQNQGGKKICLESRDSLGTKHCLHVISY